MAACLTMTLMAAILGQTDMTYNPGIRWKPMTPAAWFFCAGYAVFCLMPMILDLWTDRRFSDQIIDVGVRR